MKFSLRFSANNAMLDSPSSRMRFALWSARWTLVGLVSAIISIRQSYVAGEIVAVTIGEPCGTPMNAAYLIMMTAAPLAALLSCYAWYSAKKTANKIAIARCAATSAVAAWLTVGLILIFR